MRSFLLALAATVLFLGNADAQPESKLKKKGGPVIGPKVVRELPANGKAQGTLVRGDAKGKFFELQTDKGLVKVPARGKVFVQDGVDGRPVQQTFNQAQSLAARRIVIVIRTGDTIIIIIIRTRT